MAWRSYNYSCPNDQCKLHEQVQDLLVDYDDRDSQRCDVCGMTLTRLVCGPKNKHISWSTWQV